MGTIRKMVAMYYWDNKAIIREIRNGSFELRRKLFSQIDFVRSSGGGGSMEGENDSCCSAHLTVDDLKTMATQLAMSCALLRGIEVYTKKDIVRQFPFLLPFIYRQHDRIRQRENAQRLNSMVACLSDALKHVTALQEDQLVLFDVRLPQPTPPPPTENQKTDDDDDDDISLRNHFLYQCQGMYDTHTHTHSSLLATFMTNPGSLSSLTVTISQGGVYHIDAEQCLMYGWDDYQLDVPIPEWPHITAQAYAQMVHTPGEREARLPGGRWGRVVHLFAHKGVCDLSALSSRVCVCVCLDGWKAYLCVCHNTEVIYMSSREAPLHDEEAMALLRRQLSRRRRGEKEQQANSSSSNHVCPQTTDGSLLAVGDVSLDLERFFHIFQIFHHHHGDHHHHDEKSNGGTEEEETERDENEREALGGGGVGELYLVGLRCTFSYELISSPEALQRYADAAGGIQVFR